MGSLVDKYSKDELIQIVKNSFSYAEVTSKLGYSTKNGSNNKTVKKRIAYYGISTDHFCHQAVKTDWTDEEIFCKDSKVSQNKLRRTFKQRQFVPYVCSVCGLPPFWNGMPLVLTLDHINGEHTNNEVQNLRWVCPNCDRQSSTFGMRNKKKLEKETVQTGTESIGCDNHNRGNIQIPNRQELKNKLWECKNYTQVANFYNVSTTQIRRWCRSYNLPATINIVKYTSEIGWLNENWNDVERQTPKGPEPPKPCYMIDKTSGLVIMEFSSRHEAGRYVAPDAKRAEIHIGKVCNGDRKSAYGYFWRDKK